MILPIGNLIGGLISGALKGVGAIFGGISAAKAAKREEQNLKRQMAENQQWYDQRYNEDATQRADAQRMLAMTQEAIKERNNAAAASAAVMGGTEESLAATKAANAQAMADTASQIAVAGAQRKDQIENQYMAKKDTLNDKMNELQQRKAQNISNAISGVADAAGSIAGGLM